MLPVLRRGPWLLKDLETVPQNRLKVFSAFHCGGGSSMGYKLAGYNVLGGVEIDKKMMEIYRRNHKPRHSYLMSVTDFNELADSSLPKELFNLDILDGSPPCSTFSMTGKREKSWGKLKMFREGQAVQVLDDLFGHFLIMVGKLRPKVVIAENVKGIIAGSAKGYVKEIISGMQLLGYRVQVFLLNSAKMGVPQRRERVFFIANRLDVKILLAFDEKIIGLKQSLHGVLLKKPRMVGVASAVRRHWSKCPIGNRFSGTHIENVKMRIRSHPLEPAYTLTTTNMLFHWSEPRRLQGIELNRIQTFPDDFDFLGMQPDYVCGMSVPPFMMQRIAHQIYLQCFASRGGAAANG